MRDVTKLIDELIKWCEWNEEDSNYWVQEEFGAGRADAFRDMIEKLNKVKNEVVKNENI